MGHGGSEASSGSEIGRDYLLLLARRVLERAFPSAVLLSMYWPWDNVDSYELGLPSQKRIHRQLCFRLP